MIDFITTPRSINKTDAVSLVSQFGTLRTAVNARHEDVSGIAGWGEKKVQAWTKVVREPFRVQRAAKRGLGREASSMQADGSEASGSPAPAMSRFRDEGAQGTGGRPGTAAGDADADERPTSRLAEVVTIEGNVDEGEAIAESMTAPPIPPKDAVVEPPAKRRKPDDDSLNNGVMAALSKLRKA